MSHAHFVLLFFHLHHWVSILWLWCNLLTIVIVIMSPISLEAEDHLRDADFNRVMHGLSAKERSNFRAMLAKDPKAQKAAAEEYFKHWDNKTAASETAEIRLVSAFRSELAATLTLVFQRKGDLSMPL